MKRRVRPHLRYNRFKINRLRVNALPMRNAPKSPRSAIVRHLSRLSDLQLGAQRAETGHSAAKLVHFRNAGHRSRLASIACGPFQERSSRNPTRMGRSSGLPTTWRFHAKYALATRGGRKNNLRDRKSVVE